MTADPARPRDGVRVSEALPADRAAWDAFVAADPAGDPLQSWGWGEVAAIGGEEPVRLLARDGSGAIRGLAQVLVRRTGLGRSVLYVPHGPLWSRDARGDVALDALLEAVRGCGERERGIVAKLDPRAPLGAGGGGAEAGDAEGLARMLLGRGLVRARHDLQARTTRILDLSVGPDALLASFERDTRNLIRRSAKEGVVTQVVRDPDPAPYRAFASLLAATGTRAGFRVRSAAALERLAAEFAPDGRVRLVLADLDGVPIAGCLALLAGPRAFYLYAGSLRAPAFRHANAAYASLWALCRALADDGVASLDLWGVAEAGDPGADASWAGFSLFKRGFGGAPVRHPGTFDLVLSPAWYRLRDWREQRQSRGVRRGERGRAHGTAAATATGAARLQSGAVHDSEGSPVSEGVAGRDASPAGLRIVDASAWEAGAWDALATRSPHGEVFQSHAWGETKRPLGWRIGRYVIEVAGEPVAVVSFQERRLGARLPGPLGRLTYLYAPRGPVLLREDSGVADAALAAIRRIARGRHAAVVTLDPAWEEGGELAAAFARNGFEPALREVQVSRTAMIVPLHEDEGAQHQLLGDSTARNINKARRAGVVAARVDLADPAEREPALDEFWEMFVATGRREGFVVRDRTYQFAQWRAIAEAGHASLWFASAGDRRRNGVLLLHCGHRLVSHQAGSPDDADLRGTRANHLLQWEIIRWAAGAGFTSYDLGGVDTQEAPGIPLDRTHPLWNLYEFKRGFGARGVVLARAQEHAPHVALGRAWRLVRHVR